MIRNRKEVKGESLSIRLVIDENKSDLEKGEYIYKHDIDIDFIE